MRVAVLALAVAVAAAVGITLALRAPKPAGSGVAVSVAVLPFSDLSPAADHQYFADGVHEEIIARLAGTPALRVASQSAVDSYRGSGKPVRDVARELGVGAVLQGTGATPMSACA